MEFQYEQIEVEASYTLDIRGRSGVPGVRPHFQSVTGVIRVTTSEPEGRFRQLAEKVDTRCPMYNLIKAAGVDIRMQWEKVER